MQGKQRLLFSVILPMVVMGSTIGLSSCASGPAGRNDGGKDGMFTVTWVNDDKRVLKIDEVLPNTLPHYDGPTPAKVASKDKAYDFNLETGWDKKLEPVTADITYKVAFAEKSQVLTYEYDAGTDGYVVKGFKDGHKDEAEAIINSDYNGERGRKPVTGIGQFAFGVTDSNRNNTLKRVTIPDTVGVVDIGAFLHCTALEAMEWSVEHSHLETLQEFAFFGTAGPWTDREIVLPKAVKTLKIEIFNESQATKVVLPAGITILPDRLFSDCERLTEITIPDNVEEIGKNVFGDTPLATLYIPAKVGKVGSKILDGCKSLTSISSGVAAPEDGGNIPEGWNADWLEGSGIETVSWGETRPLTASI